MAKVLKRGTLSAPEKKWPIGLHCICPACGCEWEVETVNDYISMRSAEGPTGKRRISVACPECGKRYDRKDERQKTDGN